MSDAAYSLAAFGRVGDARALPNGMVDLEAAKASLRMCGLLRLFGAALCYVRLNRHCIHTLDFYNADWYALVDTHTVGLSLSPSVSLKTLVSKLHHRIPYPVYTVSVIQY